MPLLAELVRGHRAKATVLMRILLRGKPKPGGVGLVSPRSGECVEEGFGLERGQGRRAGQEAGQEGAEVWCSEAAAGNSFARAFEPSDFKVLTARREFDQVAEAAEKYL
jgi:hypothetical protein